MTTPISITRNADTIAILIDRTNIPEKDVEYVLDRLQAVCNGMTFVDDEEQQEIDSMLAALPAEDKEIVSFEDVIAI